MLKKQRLELVNLSQALQKLKIKDERKKQIMLKLVCLQLKRELDIYRAVVDALPIKYQFEATKNKNKILKEINDNIGIGYTEEQTKKIIEKNIFNYLIN